MRRKITERQIMAAARVLAYADIEPADLVHHSIAEAAVDLLMDRADLRFYEAWALVGALVEREESQ